MLLICSFPGFDLTILDLDFTILAKIFMNHILAENTYFMNHIEWTECNIMVIKLVNKYQVILQCHNFKNIITSYIYQAKVL